MTKIGAFCLTLSSYFLLTLTTVQLDNDYSRIQKSAELNFIRWPILGKELFINGFGYENRLSHEDEFSYLKNWLTARYTWFDSKMNDGWFDYSTEK